MKRRKLLKSITLASGAVMSASSFSSLLLSCRNAAKTSDISLSFFDQATFSTITTLSDIIIPKSDSPSASEVGVPLMIDQIVAGVYSEDGRTDFKEKVNVLMSYLDEKNFDSSSDEEKLSLLQEISESGRSELIEAFNDIKGQCVSYYLSSKEISTNELNYLPLPKEYLPCISLSEVNNRAWAY